MPRQLNEVTELDLQILKIKDEILQLTRDNPKFTVKQFIKYLNDYR